MLHLKKLTGSRRRRSTARKFAVVAVAHCFTQEPAPRRASRPLPLEVLGADMDPSESQGPDAEPQPEPELSAAMRAKIERNRQRALMLRQARLASRPLSAADGAATAAKVSRTVDSGAGFFIEEDGGEEEQEEQRRSRRVVQQPGGRLGAGAGSGTCLRLV